MTYAYRNAKPAWESKINWTQIVAVLAMGLTMFGIDLEPELQERLAVALSSIVAAVTIIWRTWFTSKHLI